MSEYTDLLKAIREGVQEEVQALLETEAVKKDIEDPDNAHQVLSVAIQYNQLSIAIELLLLDTIKEHASLRNNSALRSAAIRRDFLPVVQELLKIKAVLDNLSALPINAIEALDYAAQKGNLSIVQELVKIAPILDALSIYAIGNDHLNPLLTAVKSGHREIVECLLKVPSLLFTVAHNNFILNAAYQKGDMVVVKQLLAVTKTFDPKIISDIFLDATEKGNEEMIIALISHDQFDPKIVSGIFLDAAKQGDDKMIEVFISHDQIDFNALMQEKAEGKNALWWAEKNNHPSTANVLRDKAFELDRKDVERFALDMEASGARAPENVEQRAAPVTVALPERKQQMEDNDAEIKGLEENEESEVKNMDEDQHSRKKPASRK